MTRVLIVLAMAGVLSVPRLVEGQGAVKVIEPIDSLRKMNTMRVVVEDMPALQNALSVRALESAIARRLRDAGIEVPAGATTDPVDAFTPYLYINLNAIKTEPTGYVVSINLQFKRAVEVNNIDGNLNFLFSPTWERGGLAIVPFDAAKRIQQSIDELVTAFLEDFRTVNPR